MMKSTLIGRGIMLAVMSQLIIKLAFAAPTNNDDWAAPLEQANRLLANQQYQKSLTLFKQQAEKNNGLAQFNVALFYELGWGVQKDPELACAWFKQAAYNNTPVAMLRFGQCLEQGLAATENNIEAVDWYLKSYQQGLADGACHAGELYLKNHQIKQGEQLCLEAALKGSVMARKKLAHWYYYGQYLTQNYQQAYKWLSVSAGKASPESAFLLATYFDKGIGMPVDINKALYWYELAASQKYKQAYLPTALLYWSLYQSEVNERRLAKSYLWASVLNQSSTDDKTTVVSNRLLAQINEQMPTSWQLDLNDKVQEHLQSNVAPTDETAR